LENPRWVCYDRGHHLVTQDSSIRVAFLHAPESRGTRTASQIFRRGYPQWGGYFLPLSVLFLMMKQSSKKEPLRLRRQSVRKKAKGKSVPQRTLVKSGILISICHEDKNVFLYRDVSEATFLHERGVRSTTPTCERRVLKRRRPACKHGLCDGLPLPPDFLSDETLPSELPVAPYTGPTPEDRDAKQRYIKHATLAPTQQHTQKSARFEPSHPRKLFHRKLSPGGVALVQLIDCSHVRFHPSERVNPPPTPAFRPSTNNACFHVHPTPPNPNVAHATHA